MLLIFDCDGVLVDSELIALEVLSAMMGEYGHAMDVAACRDAFMGRHNADIIRAIEARIGRALPGEGQVMRARMLERLRRELQPVQGIADALARLPGPRCVASSSDHERIAIALALTGLTAFFGPHIFSGMDVAHGKPAPDLFLHAARSMGFAPSDCVVIEDSVTGVLAGRPRRHAGRRLHRRQPQRSRVTARDCARRVPQCRGVDHGGLAGGASGIYAAAQVAPQIDALKGRWQCGAGVDDRSDAGRLPLRSLIACLGRLGRRLLVCATSPRRRIPTRKSASTSTMRCRVHCTRSDARSSVRGLHRRSLPMDARTRQACIGGHEGARRPAMR